MKKVLASALLVLVSLVVLPARADQPVVIDRTRTNAVLGDVLEDLARLEGRMQGQRGGCRALADDIAKVRQTLKSMQDELRAAPAASDQVSVTMGAGPGGVSVTAGGTGATVNAGPAGAYVEAGPNGAYVNAGANGAYVNAGVSGAVVTTTTHSTTTTTTAEPAPEPEPAPAPQGTIAPIRSHRLDEIMRALKAEDFSDGKIGVLSDAAGYDYFTAEQIARILGAFDFGNDKLKALAILAPRLYDPENAFKIYKAFEFDSDKAKARKILSQHR